MLPFPTHFISKDFYICVQVSWCMIFTLPSRVLPLSISLQCTLVQEVILYLPNVNLLYNMQCNEQECTATYGAVSNPKSGLLQPPTTIGSFVCSTWRLLQLPLALLNCHLYFLGQLTHHILTSYLMKPGITVEPGLRRLNCQGDDESYVRPAVVVKLLVEVIGWCRGGEGVMRAGSASYIHQSRGKAEQGLPWAVGCITR